MYHRKVPTPEDFNRVVNSIWKDVPREQIFNVHPNLAANFVRAIWKQQTGRKFRWKIRFGTGNRHTWLRSGVFTINPNEGWYEINHSMAHFIERRTSGGCHTDKQLRCERDGAQLIVRRFLRTEPYVPKPKKERDLPAERAARVEKRIKKWEAKAKRAQTALKKLRTKKRYYDRVLSDRTASTPSI